jgi:hypothetical protein
MALHIDRDALMAGVQHCLGSDVVDDNIGSKDRARRRRDFEFRPRRCA